MKVLFLSLSVSLLALFLPASSFALNLSGSYKTSEGNMKLKQNGDRVTGSYSKDNGEVTGVLYDSTLDGFWIEDNSDRRCSSSKKGRYYWGRFALEFTNNGFSGAWGYCNDTPSRSWNGNRDRESTSFSSDSDSFAADNDTESIEGLWASSEGDITLRRSGDKITGQYNPQDNGEISGRMRGSNLDAFWIENSSSTRCNYPKNGRYYWGKLKLTFERNHFLGKWGYCDERPSRQWTGQRK